MDAVPNMPHWVQILSAVAVVLTAGGVIWHKAIKPGFKLAQRANSILDFVQYEMSPNGGNSLRDKVNRIAATQEVMQIKQAGIIVKVDDLVRTQYEQTAALKSQGDLIAGMAEKSNIEHPREKT